MIIVLRKSSLCLNSDQLRATQKAQRRSFSWNETKCNLWHQQMMLRLIDSLLWAAILWIDEFDSADNFFSMDKRTELETRTYTISNLTEAFSSIHFSIIRFLSNSKWIERLLIHAQIHYFFGRAQSWLKVERCFVRVWVWIERDKYEGGFCNYKLPEM